MAKHGGTLTGTEHGDLFRNRCEHRFGAENGERGPTFGYCCAARLAEAVEAHREATQELTRERVPLQWAVTQHTLAVAYRALFEKDREPRHFDDALKAIDGALEEFRTANKSRLIEMAEFLLREKILAVKGAL